MVVEPVQHDLAAGSLTDELVLQPFIGLLLGRHLALCAGRGVREGAPDTLGLDVDLPAATAINPAGLIFSIRHNFSFLLPPMPFWCKIKGHGGTSFVVVRGQLCIRRPGVGSTGAAF